MTVRYYQLIYLISPDFSEKELSSFQEKINSLIREKGGVLAETPPTTSGWGAIRKKLGYPIKKKSAASLVTLNFQLLPEKLESLEKKLKSESQILRYIILTKKVPKAIEVAKKIKLPPRKPKIEVKKPKPKVELKEIEKKLEEILGE